MLLLLAEYLLMDVARRQPGLQAINGRHQGNGEDEAGDHDLDITKATLLMGSDHGSCT